MCAPCGLRRICAFTGARAGLGRGIGRFEFAVRDLPRSPQFCASESVECALAEAVTDELPGLCYANLDGDLVYVMSASPVVEPFWSPVAHRSVAVERALRELLLERVLADLGLVDLDAESRSAAGSNQAAVLLDRKAFAHHV